MLFSLPSPLQNSRQCVCDMHFDTGELHCRKNFKEGQLKPEFMMLGGACVCVGGVEVPFACTVLITKFPMHTEFLNLTGFDEVLMHYTI